MRLDFVYVLFLSHMEDPPKTNTVRRIRIPSIAGGKLKDPTLAVVVGVPGIDVGFANTMDISCVLKCVVYHTQ